MCVYIYVPNFNFSCMTLTSFRQVVVLPTTTTKLTLKKPTQIRVKDPPPGLKQFWTAES